MGREFNIVQNSYHQIQECTVGLNFAVKQTGFCTKSFYSEEIRKEVVLAVTRQPDRGEVEEVTVMADLSLYLTNVNVSLGKTMENDKVSPCGTTFATFRVCE